MHRTAIQNYIQVVVKKNYPIINSFSMIKETMTNEN